VVLAALAGGVLIAAGTQLGGPDSGSNALGAAWPGSRRPLVGGGAALLVLAVDATQGAGGALHTVHLFANIAADIPAEEVVGNLSSEARWRSLKYLMSCAMETEGPSSSACPLETAMSKSLVPVARMASIAI